MLSPAATRAFRWYAPIIASMAMVLTLITCLILDKVNDVYTGGLTLPYYSDISRDSPSSYVFGIGALISTIALVCSWLFNYEFQSTILCKHIQFGPRNRLTICWKLSLVLLCILPVFGLPIFTFATTINTFVSYKIYSRAKWPRTPVDRVGRIRTVTIGDNIVATVNTVENVVFDEEPIDEANVGRTLIIQAIIFSILLTGYLLYQPIGGSLVKDAPRLSIQECMDRNLGEKYCNETQRYNDTLTKLWNYEDDVYMNQIRAAGQLVYILMLVGYSLTFLSHDYARVVDREH